MADRGSYAKGRAKRDEIVEVALDLFGQKGYDRTSVREIARLTGLSQGLGAVARAGGRGARG